MKKTYQLENLDCANCAAKMETAINQIEGVDKAVVSFMTQKLTIETSGDIEKIMAEVIKVISRVEPDCEVIL